MKRTIRNLIVAAPLATLALTMTPGSAMAFGPGPQPPIAIPTPDPHPGPKDKAPKPQPKPPKGPGDLAIPKPSQPKPSQPSGNTGGNSGTQGTDTDTKATAGETDTKATETDSAVNVPDACLTHDLECNASAPVEKVAASAAQDDEDGMDLSWLLAGGAIVSASGVAFAARKRARNNA